MCRFWAHGMVDYLRHAVIIKRDHPEAAAALGEPGGPPIPNCWHLAAIVFSGAA